MAYNYDPAAVAEYGKDRMRFELGDTMVEGGPDTTALTDEEIEAALSAYPKSWKRAKLMLLESLFRRFSYEVDTKTGPLTLSLQARAKLFCWATPGEACWGAFMCCGIRRLFWRISAWGRWSA